MTILGVPGLPHSGGFSMGIASDATNAMDLSLDEMIRQRATVKNDLADRNAGTRRAKRTAALNARRGISNNVNGKPSKMDIEKEVKKVKNKRALKNAKAVTKIPKKKAATAKEKLALEKLKKVVLKKAKKAAKEEKVALPKQPTIKAVKAARGALKEAGFQVPRGHVIQIVPKESALPVVAKASAAAPSKKTTSKKATPKKNPPANNKQKKTTQQPKKNANSNNRRGKKN